MSTWTRRGERLGSSERARFAEATVEHFLTALAADEPAPSGGAAAALACASAAALVEMAASLTPPDGPVPVAAVRERAAVIRSAATRLADDDAAAYGQVIRALRTPRDDAGRDERVAAALSRAADAPLAIAERAADAAELAAIVAHGGNPNLRGDALTGALLAEAAALAATRLVEINLASAPSDARVQRGRDLARRALAARDRALAAAE
jgi:formiminotetrahydrofolate cyclodeaminase